VGRYEDIDEEQFFVLQFNGPATTASVQEHTWCVVDGVGERVPVRLIAGKEREALLKAQGLDKRAAREPLQFATLACQRRLSSGTRMQLVFGKGVATPSGIANQVEKRFDYKVREPFTADFSCERENAQAACLPIRPMRLAFSAPVPRKLAEGVRLKSAQETVKPRIEDAADGDSVVSSLEFAAPLAGQTRFELLLPKDFKDASGRALANADSFPLAVATGDLPPLAKFAAAPFGIVERFAEGPPSDNPPALLPVTLRKVEAALQVSGLQASTLQPRSDAEIIAWLRKVRRYDDYTVPRAQARRDVKGTLPAALDGDSEWVQSRMVSLLAGQGNVKKLELPRPAKDDPRPFEVVGIPLPVGFSVVEIASPLLGQSLLDARHGAQRTMYVRTSALVTNLGVHFKLGRENAAAWVTSLDKGKPVAGAQVRVSDCEGRELAQGTTDAQGIARFEGLSPEPRTCQGEGEWRSAYFVSARALNEGVQDMAFTWSDWQRGIEPWRFNVPTSNEPRPDEIAHTVFDRTLLRAGETVSMKHLLRTQTSKGFALPPHNPDTLVITHVGSGQQYTQPLQWRGTATGGRSAQSQFQIPPAAKLGVYQVELRGKNQSFDSGSFRARRRAGQLRVGRRRGAPAGARVGAGARQAAAVPRLRRLQLQRAAQARCIVLQPERRRGGHGQPGQPRGRRQATRDARQERRRQGDGGEPAGPARGAGAAARGHLRRPQRRGADPAQHQHPVARRRGGGREDRGLGLQRQPRALPGAGAGARRQAAGGRAAVGAGDRAHHHLGAQAHGGRLLQLRQQDRNQGPGHRLHRPERQPRPAAVRGQAGRTRRGGAGGVRARQGRQRGAGRRVGLDHAPGRAVVWRRGPRPHRPAARKEKLPARRDGALAGAHAVPLRHGAGGGGARGHHRPARGGTQRQGPDGAAQGGRGLGPQRLRERAGAARAPARGAVVQLLHLAPREWWTAFWFEGREYVAPTALVDLSKPAYRLGLAEIRVGAQAHQIQVQVAADKESYPVRGKAQVTITAKLPDGKPAAGAEVALAAVDQALLELMPNTSWNLLDAMLQRRSWGVATSTAQMEIIGRRHYGRKAVPAGGGGGRSSTRELFDTLLLWQPALQLDANGQAKVTVPLNDALTTFKIVAVADLGAGQFGTGQTALRTTQDLQLISGLPPLVREDDQFRAQITLRNTTQAAMKVEVAPRATLLALDKQTVDIPAGESREVAWNVTAPAQLAQTRAESIVWEIEARDTVSGARDALKASQRIIPAVPLTVQQATLVQVDGSLQLPVAPPQGALPGRGGLKLSLQPKLAEGLPGVRDWWAHYPFACLEQKTSKSIGLRDAKLWQTVAAQLPTYLDGDGLAYYFPPRDGDANRGSDTLTAYLLAATHEASGLDPAFALPDEARAAMERGLAAFVEGRIERNFWSPRKDLDMRKLAAIEALSRYGKAHARMLTSITVAPNQWPTHAVIDWINILKRVDGVPERRQRLQEAQQILKARLSYQGTRLLFSTEQDDYWWWLMQNGDVNTARLMLAVMDDPEWQPDMGRLANGFISRQQGGAWHTTTANFWGGLALEKFSARFEATPVAGTTRAAMGAAHASVDWAKVERIKTSDATGAAHQSTWFGAPAAPGMLKNNGMFLPWSPAGGKESLSVTHQGAGKPWLTLQSVAAVQLKAPFSAGYAIKKTVTPIEQANKGLPAGQYTRGDVLRVTLEVTSTADMTWVAITDPIPAGSTILGSGLGRDSEIATQGEKREGWGWPAFEERSFESFRSYYEYLPKGAVKMEYTVRLNNAGDFQLPPSRVEALYAPEMFGEAPNARVKVVQP